jgi:hypothetical protein
MGLPALACNAARISSSTSEVGHGPKFSLGANLVGTTSDSRHRSQLRGFLSRGNRRHWQGRAAQSLRVLLALSEMLADKRDHLSMEVLMKIATVETRRIGAGRRVTCASFGVQVARKEKCLAFVTK